MLVRPPLLLDGAAALLPAAPILGQLLPPAFAHGIPVARVTVPTMAPPKAPNEGRK